MSTRVKTCKGCRADHSLSLFQETKRPLCELGHRIGKFHNAKGGFAICPISHHCPQKSRTYEELDYQLNFNELFKEEPNG